jgi:hypothetical protein
VFPKTRNTVSMRADVCCQGCSNICWDGVICVNTACTQKVCRVCWETLAVSTRHALMNGQA